MPEFFLNGLFSLIFAGLGWITLEAVFKPWIEIDKLRTTTLEKLEYYCNITTQLVIIESDLNYANTWEQARIEFRELGIKWQAITASTLFSRAPLFSGLHRKITRLSGYDFDSVRRGLIHISNCGPHPDVDRYMVKKADFEVRKALLLPQKHDASHIDHCVKMAGNGYEEV